MSLIEKAVQRLEELKRAGADLTSDDGPALFDAPRRPIDRGDGGAAQAPEHREPTLRAAVPERAASRAPKSGADVAVSRHVEIDLARLGAGGMVTPDAPRSRIADEYRVIKRPLLMNAQGKGAAPVHNGNLIMVTSAMPGEGKSFTAINLAMSMAMELDNTVLLVDADLARQSVLNVLGLPPAKGLMDVVAGDDTGLPDVLLKTNVERLSLLPAGTAHPRATELLASDGMLHLLDEMAARYPDRIIVFDSPPLLVTTEARTLAAHMGQIVLVVEAEKTTHATVKQALSTIEACPVKLLMLNKTTRSKAGSYYGYYGYYGYGGYGDGDGA
ncbi:MAG: XrtA-associated tyrosine autokinase [Rhodocyclaceae bacterium]